MAIDRTAFNALIDDDGSGTTGTPWNKAQIAAVILDPTDAVLFNPSAIAQDLIFTSNQVLRRSVNTGSLALSGGTGIGPAGGGTVQGYGNTSATNPGGLDVLLGTGTAVARVINSASSVVQSIDNNGLTQFLTSADIGWNFNSTHGNGASIRLQNNGTQNVLIGGRAVTGTGSAADAVIYSAGNLYLWPQSGYIVPQADNNYALGSTTHRWTVVYATTGTINTSDARQKRDIADSDLGLAFVERLRPVRYRFRDHDPERVQYGLIAQELAALEGGAAFVYGTDADGFGTNYASFTAPMIAAIQELARRLAALEGRRPS